MRKLLFIIAALPFFSYAQTKNINSLPIGFEISGNVTGFDDGTSVSFLNDQTGVPEKETTIEKGKFIIKGKVVTPTFKVLVFGDQPPVIPIFLENGKIQISGDKNKLAEISISGSKSHEEYMEYSKSMQPYASIFNSNVAPDPASVVAFESVASGFVKSHPSSYVSPIAIIQVIQASKNMVMAENLFKVLSPKVKESDLSKYVNQIIQEAKINAIGTLIPEFSQMDTSGKMVSISSLKGKYVLIDFWASWCRPCREENPNVVAAFNKYQSKNFTVFGVSLDQAKPAWISAIQMDGLTWAHVSDLKGWQNEVAAQFHVTSIPQNLLIDPTGKIIAKNLRGQDLLNKLEELLK